MPKNILKTILFGCAASFSLTFLFPLTALACNCMCYYSKGSAQYVGTASDDNCAYFWCDTSSGLSGTPYCADGSSNSSGNVFSPQITIPGSDFQAGKTITVSNNTATIANYVKAIYKYLIGIIGIVACIMLMVGGIVWLTAGGSPEKVKQAQEYIIASLTGLVLALGSFMILGTINPALVNFNISTIKPVSNTTDSTATDAKKDCVADGTVCGYWPVKTGSAAATCCPKCCSGSCVKGGYSFGNDEAKCSSGLGY